MEFFQPQPITENYENAIENIIINVILFAFFILSLTAVTSGWIDQKIHGQMTVYVIGCIIIAAMFNYKPKVTALLYGLSGVAFMIFLTISQKDQNIRQGHYVNGSLLVVISYFLSTVLYKYKQQDLLNKYFLEDLVTERTKELQTANDLLTQEIFERKRSEIEMARLDRLNLIGEMAASISHEVRNPMTTVKGFLQLLKNKQESRDKEFFELNIQEIRQLLLNLVRNGLEVMSSGGHLRIRTFSSNSEVALAVSDEGNGIEQHMLEKLGTPFFTTKEQGTGLGLAVCYGIVSRHNGRISVETSPKGSTFYVYFKLS